MKKRKWKMWARHQEPTEDGGLHVRVFRENLEMVGYGEAFRVEVRKLPKAKRKGKG